MATHSEGYGAIRIKDLQPLLLCVTCLFAQAQVALKNTQPEYSTRKYEEIHVSS